MVSEMNEMEKTALRKYPNELTSSIVDVKGTRSYVSLCGCGSTDIPKLKKVVLLIPGNPGCITFYENFILSLKSQLGIPVIGISHAHHQREALTGSPSSRLFLTDVYDLQQQIQHKIDFVNDYFDEDTEILLIGHSIGAYICLKIMQHFRNSNNVNRNFVHSFLLMPTVERMRVSPQGQQMILFLKHLRYLVMFLHVIFTSILPDIVIRRIFVRNDPDCIQRGAKSLCATRCFNNVFYMAANELKVVDQLDKDLIQESLSSATFYYTPGDHWAPESYGEQLKARFPKADVIIGTEGMTHEFLRTQSEEMSQILCRMMSKRKIFVPQLNS